MQSETRYRLQYDADAARMMLIAIRASKLDCDDDDGASEDHIDRAIKYAEGLIRELEAAARTGPDLVEMFQRSIEHVQKQKQLTIIRNT